jgi:LAO/AO transport system kinase
VFQHHGTLEAVEAPDTTLYNSWIPPIQKTVATNGMGIAELAAEVARHAEHLRESGDWVARERSRLESELDTLLQETLVTNFRREVPESRYEDVLEQVCQRELAPWEAVKMLLNGQSK